MWFASGCWWEEHLEKPEDGGRDAREDAQPGGKQRAIDLFRPGWGRQKLTVQHRHRQLLASLWSFRSRRMVEGLGIDREKHAKTKTPSGSPCAALDSETSSCVCPRGKTFNYLEGRPLPY